MHKIVCDRCGKAIPSDIPVGKKRFNPLDIGCNDNSNGTCYYVQYTLDLCCDCTESFFTWLKEEGVQ